MSLKEKLSKRLGLYFDPKVSLEKLIDDLDKGGQFDKKMIKVMLVEIIEHLDSQEK